MNVEALAGYDLAIAQAGNRSKQIWALSAMIGTWVRMAYSDPCQRTTGVPSWADEECSNLSEWFAMNKIGLLPPTLLGTSFTLLCRRGT